MYSQVLSPGVQNAEEPTLAPRRLGLAATSSMVERCAEEQIVEQPWIVLTERVELLGQGKDDGK